MQVFKDILDKNQEASDAKIAAKAKAIAEADAKAKAKAEAEAALFNAWLTDNYDTVAEQMKLQVGEFLKENKLRPAEVTIKEVPEWDLYNRWCRFGGFEIEVEYLDLDGSSYVWKGADVNRDLHEFYFCHVKTVFVEEFVRVGEGYCVVLSDFPRSRDSSLSTWDCRNDH